MPHIQRRRGLYSVTFEWLGTVYPARASASMMVSTDSFSSSNSTVTVWSFMSVWTDRTSGTFSTAARALAEVPPQTTPGVCST